MKFTINKKEISGVLSNIQGLAGRKSNLAITETVLLKASADRITLIATDLETGFEGTYPASIEVEGTIAINARKFFEIVRDFPTDDILVNEVENRWIEIGNEKVLYHIVGMNPDDFPETPRITDVPFVQIDAIALKKMVERTIVIAHANDEKRAHILGVYCQKIDQEGQKLFRLVSTDGSRLSKVDYDLGDKADFEDEPGVLIPKKGLSEVNRFLDAEETVEVGVKHNHFIVQKKNETLVTRLLEGEFPQYGDIVLKQPDGIDIKLDRQLFLMMLKRMSILSSDNYKSVMFKFEDDKLEITTTNPDIGESKEDMVIIYQGKPIEVAFNPKYFIDTMNVINEDTVVLNMKSEERPCLIEAEEEKLFISVIMPMRI